MTNNNSFAHVVLTLIPPKHTQKQQLNNDKITELKIK